LLKVKEEQLEFATKIVKKPKMFWRKVIYTDKLLFNIQILRRLKIWYKKGERQYLDCIQFKFHSGRKSFQAWGAIGYRFKSKLIVVSKEIDSKGIIAKVARGQQEGLQYSRDNNIIQDNNIVKKGIDLIVGRIVTTLL
jgi:hypothetical protein